MYKEQQLHHLPPQPELQLHQHQLQQGHQKQALRQLPCQLSYNCKGK
jgi:hypothetical protein